MILDRHHVCRSLDLPSAFSLLLWRKSLHPSSFLFASFLLSNIFFFRIFFSFVFFFTILFSNYPDGPGQTRKDPASARVRSCQLVLAHFLTLCFPFWQSYFINLFDGGLQCKSIRTLSIKNLQCLCKDFELFFEGKNPFCLTYLHSSNPCQRVKYFDIQYYNTLFYYSIIELIHAVFEHFSLEMVCHLILEHVYVQSLSLSYKISLN